MRRRLLSETGNNYDFYIVATFTGEGTTATKILGDSYNQSYIDAMYVDDSKIATCKTHTFGDTSSHTVIYAFDSPGVNMEYMFQKCTTLTKVESSTLSITSIANCFNQCLNLTTVNLTNAIPSFTDASNTFYYCKKLTTIVFNTTFSASLKNTSNMFAYCESLTSIDLTYYNLKKVTDMSYMFMECSKLTSLEFTQDHKTSLNENLSATFYGCESLTKINGLTYLVTPKVKYMSGTFFNTGLTSLDLSHFDTTNVTDMGQMFALSYSLSSLTIPFTTSNVTSMNHMFQQCKSLKSLDLSTFDTSKVTQMQYMFDYCESLTSLDLSSFNVSNVTSMSYMFRQCYALTEINGIETWVTSNATNMCGMFQNCPKLTTLDLSNFDSSKSPDMSAMFMHDASLVSVKMLGVTNVSSDVSYMFYNISTTGTFYYNDEYDYSHIIAELPSTWTAVAV